MISIKRGSSFGDRLRAYQIVLDGQVVAEIKKGQTIELDVLPGHHQIHLKIDWCRSNIVDFDLQQDVIEFSCGSNLTGFRNLLMILYITILRNHYLWLKRTS